MDRHLLLSIVLMIYIFSNPFVTGMKCPTFSQCSCLENGHTDVEVDCHGVEGIKMCSICEKIGDITSLNVNRAAISSVPSGCFSRCQKLNNLRLVSNSIRRLANYSLKGLKKLEYLNLNDNMLLQSNELSSFETFKTLGKLSHLSMRNNSRSEDMPIAYVDYAVFFKM